MSKVGTILETIRGANVFGADGLADYHRARAVRDACRKRLLVERFETIRQILRPYNVIVSLRGENVRIFRPETQREILL